MTTGGGKLTYLAEQIHQNYVYTCTIAITYLLGGGALAVTRFLVLKE